MISPWSTSIFTKSCFYFLQNTQVSQRLYKRIHVLTETSNLILFIRIGRHQLWQVGVFFFKVFNNAHRLTKDKFLSVSLILDNDHWHNFRRVVFCVLISTLFSFDKVYWYILIGNTFIAKVKS